MSSRDNESFNYFIFVMNADGSNPTRLTDTPNIDGNPSWGNGDVLPPPVIVTAINPNRGAEAGGTPVTITGSGFLGGTITVFFGGAAATDVAVVSDTTINATAPPGRGQVLIDVRRNNLIANTGVLFTYDPPASGSNPQPAIIGTSGDGNVGVVFPRPNENLPAPVQNVVTGLPTGAQPHGVDYFEADKGIISDFNNSRVFIVRISTNALLETIGTPNYNGTGTIAVAPTFNFALASGFTDALTVISAPFSSASPVNTIPLPGSVASFQTQSIVFNSAGRAFVYHSTGISVLDAPYTSIAFTIPVNTSGNGAIAITPDGNTLRATDGDGGTIGTSGTTFGSFSKTVRIFTAPFSASSTAAMLTIGNARSLDGIRTTPDGNAAIVVDIAAPRAFVIAAPFGSTSTVERLPIAPDVITAGLGFEDVDISPDGQLAILTGQSGGSGAPAAFIRAPFTAAGARSFAVPIAAGGRGAGSVRFLPRNLAAVLNVSKSAPASVDSGANLTYTINYSNTGALKATNAVIRDPLPAGTTFVSAINGGTLSGNTVVFNLGTINAVSGTQSVSFTVNVTAASGSTVTNGGYTLQADGIAAFTGMPVTTSVIGTTPIPQARAELRAWTIPAGGEMRSGSFGFVKLTFPNDAYRVTNWAFRNTNYGLTAEMQVKRTLNPGAGRGRRGFLRFDTSTTVGAITSAKLRIYARLTESSLPPTSMIVQKVTDTTWNELTMTWNNQPPTASPNALGQITVTNANGQYYDFDLTQFIQAERAAGRMVVSFRLINQQPTGSSGVSYTSVGSREPGSRPQLLIEQ